MEGCGWPYSISAYSLPSKLNKNVILTAQRRSQQMLIIKGWPEFIFSDIHTIKKKDIKFVYLWLTVGNSQVVTNNLNWECLLLSVNVNEKSNINITPWWPPPTHYLALHDENYLYEIFLLITHGNLISLLIKKSSLCYYFYNFLIT